MAGSTSLSRVRERNRARDRPSTGERRRLADVLARARSVSARRPAHRRRDACRNLRRPERRRSTVPSAAPPTRWADRRARRLQRPRWAERGGRRGGDRFDDIVATTSTDLVLRACRAPPSGARSGHRHVVVLSSSSRASASRRTRATAPPNGPSRPRAVVRRKLAPQGIQVNAICAGWVDTDMAWLGLDAAARATGGTREDAYRDAMRAVRSGAWGNRRRSPAPSRGCSRRTPRGRRPGDRPERRRLDGLGPRRAE